MERLNDDCVCLILEYLTLTEQLTMARLSTRFRDLLSCVVWRKMRYRKLAISDPLLTPLSREDYMYFFELASAAMLEFYIGNVHGKAFDSYLGRHLWRPELAYYLRLDFRNLQKLCCMDDSMNNSMIRTIASHCPQLRSLTVSSSYITGKYMFMLSKLETLVARRCSIELTHLTELLTQLRLTYLDLICNRHRIEEAFSQAPGPLQLQWLGLSYSRDFGFHLVEQLPQLKCLVVSYRNVSQQDKRDMLEAALCLIKVKQVAFISRLLKVECNCADVKLALEQLCGRESGSLSQLHEFSDLLRVVWTFK